MYGQLLRRMDVKDDKPVTYAVVVPDEARAAACRVSRDVRKALGVAVYVVDLDGRVEEVQT
ncbi:hypothetical protein ENKNEFLB_03606 [Nocardioides aquaticus]|uniref:Uncharacterized protein n=2 Tax=Nocardioides aquaticus TaxID=160826 RepID=A0ABX8EQN1_9ACTN|nr:hypothetical protein ENKNEFLB_03606 [Nocardioides aquaticus]